MENDSRIIILLGSYSLDSDQNLLLNQFYKKSIGVSNCQYERKLLDGFKNVQPDDLYFMSCPRVGDWPISSKKICVKGFSEDKWLKTVPYKAILGFRNRSKGKALIRCLKELLREYPADAPIQLIACEAHRPYLQAIRYFKRSRRAVFSTLLVPDLPEDMSKGYKSFLYRFMKRRENKIVHALSDKYVDSFLAFTPDIERRINPLGKPSCVYEGIVERAESSHCESPAAKEEIRCGFVGSVDERNGIKLLVEASLLLPPNYKIHIYGSGDMEDFHFSDYPSVVYHGFVSPLDIPAAIENCDIMLSPRLCKGEYVKYSFPSKIFEYLSHYKKIITFRLPCYFPELDAILVYPKAETPEALAESIIETAQKGYAPDFETYDRILNKYSAESIAKAIIEFAKQRN